MDKYSEENGQSERENEEERSEEHDLQETASDLEEKREGANVEDQQTHLKHFCTSNYCGTRTCHKNDEAQTPIDDSDDVVHENDDDFKDVSTDLESEPEDDQVLNTLQQLREQLSSSLFDNKTNSNSNSNNIVCSTDSQVFIY